MGLRDFLWHEESAQWHDELEALRAGDRIPADDDVAVFNMPSGGTPDEHSDDPVFFQDKLTKPVTRFAPRPEQMLFIKQAVGDFPICAGSGGANIEPGSGEC